MSRLAQAYRKSGSGPFSGQLDSAHSAVGSWITTEVPWDLGESASPDRPRASRPLPVTTGASAPDFAKLHHRPAERHVAGPRDELLLLAQRILHAGTGERPIRSLLFAAIDCEQSADVCAGTADALACQTAGSVCVVDANLRSPSLAGFFGVASAVGMADLLRTGRALRTCVTRVTNNLWLLPAGDRAPDAASLLAGEQARHVLMELREMFDYVLLDTAPVSRSRHAIPIGSAVDGVVLVVAANVTRREAAKNAAQHLTDANLNIFGAVLTNRAFPIPEAIYRKL